MKVYYKKWHIKTLQKKFAEIKNITDYFDDFDNKRLSLTEEIALNKVLNAITLKKQLPIFMDNLKNTEPVIFRAVEGRSPIGVVEVITRDSDYCMLDFGDKMQLRCPGVFLDIVANKSTLKRLF